MKVITDVSRVTLDHLRRVLAQFGDVSSFSAEPLRADNAAVARIHIRYTAQSSSAPASLFLKCVPGSGVFGASEMHYYRRDYADVPNAPLPRCYDAAYDPATGAHHLLLQDLTETHRNNWNAAPTLDYGLALADALARLHAPYFSAEALARIGEALPSEAKLRRYLDVATRGIEPMLEAADDELTTAQRQLIHDAALHHPRLLIERAADASGMTLVHGDVNPGNILSSKTGATPIYLIDRQPFDWSLTVWLGVSDLAYAMEHWWDTPLRRAFETPILRQYRDSLSALGIQYEWDHLWRDYRLCAVQSLYVAASWCVDAAERERMRWVWQPQLRKTLAALEDLRCIVLWSE
jgi:thiamine kinase-like enzyme